MLLTWSPVTESNRRPSPYHACRFRLMASGWVGLPQARGFQVAGCVVLRLALPGVVVTCFVTGLRTSSLRDKRSLPWQNTRDGRIMVPRSVSLVSGLGSAVWALAAADQVGAAGLAEQFWTAVTDIRCRISAACFDATLASSSCAKRSRMALRDSRAVAKLTMYDGWIAESRL